jgi:hypothetical protein
MTDDKLEIFFDDLTPKAQKKVLEFLRIKEQKELNLDVLPLFILPRVEPV